jgi:RNA polymerase sigma-70 factor (ECF subfamily)
MEALGSMQPPGLPMIDPQTEQRRFLDHFLPVRGSLRTFFYAATRDAHEAEDLCQQVGAVLWRKFEQYDESRPFSAWAIGMARMELLKWRDRYRRASRSRSLSDAAITALAEAAVESAAVEPTEPDDRAAALKNCLARLAPKAREAIEKKYRDGQQIRAIAEAQGREVGAVEMALVRARRALKQCIEQAMQRGQGDQG